MASLKNADGTKMTARDNFKQPIDKNDVLSSRNREKTIRSEHDPGKRLSQPK